MKILKKLRIIAMTAYLNQQRSDRIKISLFCVTNNPAVS